MLHPIAGRYPVAVTLPSYSRPSFNDKHENDPVRALFPIAVSDDHFSTQVYKEILSILSFWEKLAEIVFAWRFVLPLNIPFFETPRQISLVSLTFLCIAACLDRNCLWQRKVCWCWGKGNGNTLHWTFFLYFTTMLVPVSTGKFPRSWVLCSHTKSKLPLEYSPVRKLSILSSTKFLVFQLG